MLVTTISQSPSLGSRAVEPQPGLDDEGPFLAWLPPEDRLWRHPSETAASGPPDRPRPGQERCAGVDTRAETGGHRVVAVTVVAATAGVIGALAACQVW